MKEYRVALAIYQRLNDGNPRSIQFQRKLVTCHNNIGNRLKATGRPTEAIEEYRRALAIEQKMADANPGAAQFKRDLAHGHATIGRLLSETGKTGEAAYTFRRAVDLDERLSGHSPVDWYNVACYHALLAGIAGKDGSGLTKDEGRVEARKALITLRRAIAAGFHTISLMRTDADLDSLRHRLEFKLLMMDAAFPAKPFARSK